MSFDTYGGPSPWESTNNKKNPFDTEETGNIQDTSSFDTKEKGVIQNTSAFNTDKNHGKVQDTSMFDTDKKLNMKKKGFIYFNPEGLPSHSKKYHSRGEKIMRSYLKNKYKVKNEKNDEIVSLKNDINYLKENTVKRNKKILEDYRKDYNEKKKRLELEALERKYRNELLQKNTKKKVFNILNMGKISKNNDEFLKFDGKEKLPNKSQLIVSLALKAVRERNKMGAIHCTDFINKLYLKAIGKSVYNSTTLFEGVKNISKGTGIGVKEYASKKDIASIIPGDHILLDLPKFGEGKTHSVLAIHSPIDGIVEVVSYPNVVGLMPRVQKIDLYGLGRIKNTGKPIRIQRG